MLKYYYLLISTLFLGSCSLTDSDQPVPSYLIINEVNVFTTDNQGAPTHKLSDVWVYADNQLVGVFEVPAKIPVIVNGETTNFSISPGFRNNGETSRSFIYNLMDAQNFTESLAPGEEIEKAITFTYKTDAKFDFVEGFEGVGHIFTLDLDENTETIIETTTESAIAGSKSGKVSLDPTNSEIIVASIFSYDRSQNAGRDSYLEIDYKCDINFGVGVIYVQEGKEVRQPLIIITPKDDWNKIYVDFTDILTSPQLETYRIYFEAGISSGNLPSGELFLDNLKFVHL